MPSPIDSAAAAASGIDFSRSVADSGNRSSGGAGSDLLRNAVAFQGDDFGVAGGFSTVSEFFSNSNSVSDTYSIIIPSSVTGKMKLAENVSPLPQNRVFLNYSLFNNVPLSENGITVNRLTPGFERTFWNKLASFEVRTPIATTLDSNIIADGSTDTRNAEFGNVFFAFKGLLLSSDTWATSAGVSVSIPTADDNRVLGSQGQELLRVENQSVHVMPFIGGLYTPTRRSFIQGVLQVDVDSNGNDVLAQFGTTNGLTKIGTMQDSTFMYCDLAIGYWLVKRDSRDNSLIRGIIPVLEGHWNRSLNDNDSVSDINGLFEVLPPIKQLDVVNVLAGLTFQLRDNSRLAFGYAVPIGNGADRVFDSEVRVTWNRYF